METITTQTWQVTGMHCSSCGIVIDEAVEEIPGVSSSTTSVRKKTTTVTLDLSKCDDTRVAAAISEAGYQASRAGDEAARLRRTRFRSKK